MSNRRKTTDQVRRMRAKQAAQERRRRALIIGGVVAVVLAVVVGTAIAIQSQRAKDTSGEAPQGATSSYGVLRGEASAPVEVVVYEDFQCPACKAVEESTGSVLSSFVDDGTIRVEYRPIAFLDRASTTDYSSRAAETAACTLDQAGSDVWVTLHGLLFEQQPAEGTAGLDDATLASMAAEAGADEDAIAQCQDDDTFTGWVAAATDQASQDGVNQTPTYFVDGEQLTFTDAETPGDTLTAAIQSATAG